MITYCLEIISDAGLQGLSWDGLLKTLGDHEVWGRDVACYLFQCKLWEFLRKSPKVEFFYRDDTKGEENEKKFACAISNGDTRGFCPAYNSVRCLNKSGVPPDLNEAMKKYPTLHVRAEQMHREGLFVKDTNEILCEDLNTQQYSVYEYLKQCGPFGSTAKEAAKVFNCNHSGVIFYLEYFSKMFIVDVAFKTKLSKQKKSHTLPRDIFYFHPKFIRHVESALKLINLHKESENLPITQTKEATKKIFVEYAKRNNVQRRNTVADVAVYFLGRLNLASVKEDDPTCYTIRHFFGALAAELKTACPQPEPFESAERYPFLRDTLLSEQLYREICIRGSAGLTMTEGSSRFKCGILGMRYLIRILMAENRIKEIAGATERNFEYRYVLPEYDNKSVKIVSDEKVKQNPRTLHRTELIKNMFEEPNTVLTRFQIYKDICKKLQENGEAVPDHKTIKRIISKLVADGFVLEITLEGSGKLCKDERLYHRKVCDMQLVRDKIRLISDLGNDLPYKNTMVSFLSCRSKLNAFWLPVPDSALSDEKHITSGLFVGPKAVFFQQLHFCLSVLYFGWNCHDCIPGCFRHLSYWWEYVNTLGKVPKNQNGYCEVRDVFYYLPIEPYIYCCTKALDLPGLDGILNNEKLKYYCIGQLPNEILSVLSRWFITAINRTVRMISVLELLELAKFEGKVDLSKKKVDGFGFKLMPRCILLNTVGAPISKQKCRGFNLKRLDLDGRIKPFHISNFKDFNIFWDTARHICINGDMPPARFILKNLRQQPKSLQQYLREHDVLTDQDIDYYEKKEVMETLENIYTELGPAGFQIQLMLHTYRAWHRVAKVKNFQQSFYPSLVYLNATKPVPGRDQEHSESEDDEYVSMLHYQNKNTKVSSKSTARKKVALARKRKIGILGDSSAAKKKRLLLRGEEKNDLEVKESRTSKCIFTRKEDMMLLMISVCDDVTDGKRSLCTFRDLLHKYCPDVSLDKTAKNCGKRLSLLLKRTGEMPHYVDLKQKSFFYAKISFPEGTDLQTLVSHRENWLRMDVRCSISRDYNRLTKRHNITLPGKQYADFVLPYAWELSNRGKRRAHRIYRVIPIWQSDGLLQHEERKLYQLVLISITSKTNTDEAQKTAQALLHEYHTDSLGEVYKFMRIRNIILKHQKVNSSKTDVQNTGLCFSSDSSSSAFQSPFPTDLNVHTLTRPRTEIEYSQLHPSHIESFNQLMASEKFDIHLGKVVISGCLRPVIDKNVYFSLLQSQEKETEVFEELHKKNTTFFSGFQSLEQAKDLGFVLTDKHIKGRPVSLAHAIAKKNCSFNCYEELLGINETSRVLPLKIFALNKGGSGFNWGKVSFKTGKLSKSNQITCRNGPTTISLEQLSNISSKFGLSVDKAKTSNLALFEKACELSSTFDDKFKKAGLDLVNQMFAVKETGMDFDIVLEVLTSSLTEQVARCLIDLLISLDIIVKVGFTHTLLVAYVFSEKWHLSFQRVLQDDNSDADVDEFSEYFPLTIKSWRLPHGDINEEFSDKLVVSIIHYIYYAPGISMWELNQRYHHVLSPQNIKEIMQFLLNVDVVRVLASRPPPTSLFAPTFPIIKINHQKIDMDTCYRLTSIAMNFASELQKKETPHENKDFSIL